MRGASEVIDDDADVARAGEAEHDALHVAADTSGRIAGSATAKLAPATPEHHAEHERLVRARRCPAFHATARPAMTTSWAMMPVFFVPIRSTSRLSAMRNKAPDRIGVDDHQEFLLRVESEVRRDQSTERAEHRPNHEADVEVEKRRGQRGPVAGFFELR